MEIQGLVSPAPMLLEKPVIFSEYGSGSETINHMHTGLLCDVYNPANIAEKMLGCIENKKTATARGEKIRNAVLYSYNLDLITKKNIQFYRSLIQWIYLNLTLKNIRNILQKAR